MIKNGGARVAGVVASGVLMLTVFTTNLPAQGIKLAGYGDLEWTLQQTDDPNDDYHNFFDNHHFNLIGIAWITGDLVAATEVEYEHAGEEISLEYGYLAYTGLRHVRIVGGKFIIPFNRFNKDLHPTIVSKMPGRPLPYNNVFPVTYADVGLWVSGGLPLPRSTARVTYDAYIVNGLKGDPNEADFRALRGNDREKPDKDDNKAVGARVGVEVGPLGLGISAYTGKYATDDVTGDDLDIAFLGADADYRFRDLELRGELVYANQDLTGGADDERTGFYLQAAYNLANVAPRLANFEPVLRYSWVNFEGDNDIQELGVGFSYYISAAAAVRVAWFFEGEDDQIATDNNKLMGQFNIMF